MNEIIYNGTKTLAVSNTKTYTNTVDFSNSNVIGLNLDSFEKELLEKLSVHPTFEHKCHNCGGTLELKANEHIFKCPYCWSVYAIGTKMINDKGNIA